MPAEVYAQEYKAKKKVNELKQMRQYFQRGNSEKTKAWVREQQKKEPCFLCDKLGHWSQECPLRQKGVRKGPHAVHVTSGGATTDPGQWSLLETIAQYTGGSALLSKTPGNACLVVSPSPTIATVDHEAFWSMRELRSSLI